MKTNISLEEAQTILLEKGYPLSEEYLPLEEALGRILSEDLSSSENIPPFNRSPLDGYAFRAEDTREATLGKPAVLKVIEELRAGYTARRIVETGCAIAVVTGSPIPEGADAVVKYEDVEKRGEYISIFSPFKSGDNIITAGEDVKIGDIVAQKGLRITPALMGLFASLGIYKVKVYRKLRIAILSTGDELIDGEEKAGPGKIRNSNSYYLAAICNSIGMQPLVLGKAKDDVDDIAAKLFEALKSADVVLTTGGASVGHYDVVQEAFKRVGGEVLYWRINVKPGTPHGAARKGDKLMISLSGNPAAAITVFQIVVMPVLKRMAGQKYYKLERIQGVLLNGFNKPSPIRRLLRGQLKICRGEIQVDLRRDQGNSIISSMIGCNLLVDVPAGSGILKPGDVVTAYLVQDIERVQ